MVQNVLILLFIFLFLLIIIIYDKLYFNSLQNIGTNYNNIRSLTSQLFINYKRRENCFPGLLK